MRPLINSILSIQLGLSIIQSISNVVVNISVIGTSTDPTNLF